MSATEWLSQLHMNNYCNFSRLVIRFFSAVEILTKYSSLHNKRVDMMHEEGVTGKGLQHVMVKK